MMPTGSSVLWRYRREQVDVVQHQARHGDALTPDGELVALGAIRRRRLIERYLVDTLGYASDEVHAEAQRLEHHISEALAARIAAPLGLPSVTSGGGAVAGAPGHLPRLAGVCGANVVGTGTGGAGAEGR